MTKVASSFLFLIFTTALSKDNVSCSDCRAYDIVMMKTVETLVAYSGISLGWIEENHQEPLSGYSLSRPRFEMGTSILKVRNFTALANLLDNITSELRS
jgi:hypothetical protein